MTKNHVERNKQGKKEPFRFWEKKGCGTEWNRDYTEDASTAWNQGDESTEGLGTAWKLDHIPGADTAWSQEDSAGAASSTGAFKLQKMPWQRRRKGQQEDLESWMETEPQRYGTCAMCACVLYAGHELECVWCKGTFHRECLNRHLKLCEGMPPLSR